MSWLEALRYRLASGEALAPLAIIGLVSGAITGVVIVAFRVLSEGALPALGLLPDAESFEVLPWYLRLGLPILGGLLIGLMFQRASVGAREVGVVHVMHQLAYRAGRLPWKNAVLQFFGAAFAVITGHSVGREGPVIHVGAASSSLVGQWFRLPNNSLRILVACGTAASIGASFNTPIAGVIFAMEVVMMEYTLIGFTPVILAAVAATSVSQAYFGDSVAFSVGELHLVSLWELPFIVFMGVCIGALAAGFNQAIFALDRTCRSIILWVRMSLAGAIVGLCALLVPAVMGIGYDSVSDMLAGQLAIGALLSLLVLKFVATVSCISMGVPGGLIGPALVIGAAAGGLIGSVGHELFPDDSATGPFYVLLGMGAMMGASLQAPLAALMAILELTSNPGIVMPGMLAIVTASLTSRVVFGQDSVYVSILRARGIEYRHDPISVSLQRTGVSAVMDRRFATIDRHAQLDEVLAALAGGPTWVLVAQGQLVVGVLEAEEVVRLAPEQSDRAPEETPDWLAGAAPEPPGIGTVPLHATLGEALSHLEETHSEQVLVARTPFAAKGAILGLLTREHIESSVRYRI